METNKVDITNSKVVMVTRVDITNSNNRVISHHKDNHNKVDITNRSNNVISHHKDNHNSRADIINRNNMLIYHDMVDHNNKVVNYQELYNGTVHNLMIYLTMICHFDQLILCKCN